MRSGRPRRAAAAHRAAVQRQVRCPDVPGAARTPDRRSRRTKRVAESLGRAKAGGPATNRSFRPLISHVALFLKQVATSETGAVDFVSRGLGCQSAVSVFDG